jgi:hypothetical protein
LLDDFSAGLAKMAGDDEDCEQDFPATFATFAIFDRVRNCRKCRGAWRGQRSASAQAFPSVAPPKASRVIRASVCEWRDCADVAQLRLHARPLDLASVILLADMAAMRADCQRRC